MLSKNEDYLRELGSPDSSMPVFRKTCPRIRATGTVSRRALLRGG